MQTLASRQVLSSTALNRRGAQLRPSRPAAAGHGRALRAAPRAAYCRPGAGWGGYGRYGGFSNDEAMRMMAEMAKQMNGAGFVFPGGRVWFGVDMDQQEQQQQGGAAAAGASCGAEQRQGGAAWRLPVDLFKEVSAGTGCLCRLATPLAGAAVACNVRPRARLASFHARQRACTLSHARAEFLWPLAPRSARRMLPCARVHSCEDGQPFPSRAPHRARPSSCRPPPLNMLQADAYVITADIPGVTKSDLTIKLTAPSPPAAPTASLLIRGARKPAAGASDDATPVMRERRRGEFERRVVLPDDGERRAARLLFVLRHLFAPPPTNTYL